MIKRTAALRLFGDAAFFYAVVSTFRLFDPWALPMALCAALVLITGLFAVEIKNAALRTAVSLLPAAAFLMGPFELPMIVPMAVCVYFSVNMALGRFALPLYEYRKYFKAMLVLSLVITAANIANSTLFRNAVISISSLVYAAVFVLVGVLSMRRMQMGAPMDLRWHAANAATVIGIPLAAVAGALVIFLVLRSSGLALSMIFYPIGRFFVWLAYKLFSKEELPVEETGLLEYLNPERRNSAVFEFTDDGKSPIYEPGEHGVNPLIIERATTVGAYVILAVLIALAVWAIFKLAKRGSTEEEEALYYDDTEVGKSGRSRRRKRIPPIGNARQIRRMYLVWLDFVKAKGLSVAASDTSREVLDSASALEDRPEAVRLRELYIAARYGDPLRVSGDSVKEARKCLEALVGEK